MTVKKYIPGVGTITSQTMSVIDEYESNGARFSEILVKPGYSVTVKLTPGRAYVMEGPDGGQIHEINYPTGPSYGNLSPEQEVDAITTARS